MGQDGEEEPTESPTPTIDSYNPTRELTSEEARIRDAKNRINSAKSNYDREWKAFQEPLQNAMDAYILVQDETVNIGRFDGAVVESEALQEVGFDPNLESKVEITLNFEDGSFTFRDHGWGIPISEYSILLQPDMTKKSRLYGMQRRQVKGHAGIGIKSSIYSSKHIAVKSKSRARCNIWDSDLILDLDGNEVDDEGNPRPEGWSESVTNAVEGEIEESEWSMEKSAPAGKSEISDFTNAEEIEFQPTPSCDLDGYGTEITIQMEGFGPKDLINASIASWVSDTRLTPSGRTDRAKIEFSQGGSGSKKVYSNLTQRHILERYLRLASYAACVTTTLPGEPSPSTMIHVNFTGEYEADIGEKKLKFSSANNFDFKAAYFSPKERLNLPKGEGGADSPLEKAVKSKHLLDSAQFRGLEKKEIIKHARALKKSGTRYDQNFFEFILGKSEIIDLFNLKDKSKAFVEQHVNGLVAIIAKSEILRGVLRVRPGTFLSANGLVTRHNWQDINLGGFEQAVHLVLDVDVTIAPSKSDITGIGASADIERRGRPQFFEALANFSGNIQNDLRTLASVVAKAVRPRKADFDEEDKTPEQDDAMKEKLLEHFCMSRIPTTEQDVIVAFNSYLASNDYIMKWLQTNQSTGYDAICEHEDWLEIAKKKESGATVAYVEYKVDPTDVIEQDSVDDPDQNMRKPVLIVGWHPVNYEKIGDLDKSYSEVDIEDDETIAEENFPSRERFPPEAMRRWGRDEDLAKADGGFHHWAYVLSLQELFTHLTGIDFDAPPEDGDVAVQAGAEGDDDSGPTLESEEATENGADQDDHQPAAEAGGEAGNSDDHVADEQTTADE